MAKQIIPCKPPSWSLLFNKKAAGVQPYFADAFCAEVSATKLRCRQDDLPECEVLNKMTSSFFGGRRFALEGALLKSVGFQSTIVPSQDHAWRVGDIYCGFKVLHRSHDPAAGVAQLILHGGAPTTNANDSSLDGSIETRTWLATQRSSSGNSHDPAARSFKVYFGSALATKGGAPPRSAPAFMMQALMPFHSWYSKFLFRGALSSFPEPETLGRR